MIGKLKGILEIKRPPFLLIDVGGVGYECQAPMSTIYQLPDVGNTITLLTHLHVREDAQILYAFYQEKERALFRALIKVSGVGPKMALTILSGIETQVFIQCVDNREITPLVRLPGVGKKTAERLVLEMAGRLDKALPEEENFSRMLFEGSSEGANERFRKINAEEEAMSALIALGYKPIEATKAIRSVMSDGATSEELIRKALQKAVRV